MILNRASRKDLIDLIDGMLNDRAAEIDKEYLKNEGSATVGLSIKLKGDAAEVTIRVNRKAIVDTGKVMLQESLPGTEKVYRMKKAGGEE